MIKNLLYSLFLHFLLLLVIYANFNLKKFDETKTSEISVSLMAMSGAEDSSKTTPTADVEKSKEPEEKPQEKPAEKTKSEKKSPKNKVKKEPKKLAKATPVKSVKQPAKEEKLQEFKPDEKPQEKQAEADKIKEDKVVNENHDEEQDDTSRKEKDFGSKEKFDKEQEAEDEEKKSNATAAEMANNIENLDLSAREKFNIQSQFKRCYRRAIDETNLSSKAKVIIKVQISEEGYVDSDLDELVDIDRYNNPKEINYKIAIDNIRRAIDLCSPLRNLPLDKYDVWKEVILEFDGEDK